MRLALLLAGLLFAAPACADDPPLLHLEQSIPLAGVEGRLDHMALNAEGTKLYLAARGNGTVEILDLAAGKSAGRIEGLKEPQDVVLVAERNRIVVSTGGDGTCRIYDAHSLSVRGTVVLGEDADNLRYDAEAQRVYCGFGEGALGLIDVVKGKSAGEIRLDGHPEAFAIDPGGKRIFVNVPSAKQIAVVDRDKGIVTTTWSLPRSAGNYAMALDAGHQRLFVGCRKPAALAVVDAHSGDTVACIPGSGDPDDIIYDPAAQKIYVACGDGAIDVIAQADANSYTALGKVETAPGARTAVADLEHKRLYLAVPHRGKQAAEVRVYSLK